MTIIVNGSNTPTAGAVGYGDGTNLAFTSAGTTGQFLQSNGSSAPSWVGAPASPMTLISTQIVTSGTGPSWTGLTGNNYLLTWQGLAVNTSGSALYIQIGTGTGGSFTWVTSSYSWSGLWMPFSSSTQTAGNSYFADSGIDLTVGQKLQVGNAGTSGSANLFQGQNQGNTYASVTFNNVTRNPSNVLASVVGGGVCASPPITAIRIYYGGSGGFLSETPNPIASLYLISN
jgi:hypothetical protein